MLRCARTFAQRPIQDCISVRVDSTLAPDEKVAPKVTAHRPTRRLCIRFAEPSEKLAPAHHVFMHGFVGIVHVLIFWVQLLPSCNCGTKARWKVRHRILVALVDCPRNQWSHACLYPWQSARDAPQMGACPRLCHSDRRAVYPVAPGRRRRLDEMRLEQPHKRVEHALPQMGLVTVVSTVRRDVRVPPICEHVDLRHHEARASRTEDSGGFLLFDGCAPLQLRGPLGPDRTARRSALPLFKVARAVVGDEMLRRRLLIQRDRPTLPIGTRQLPEDRPHRLLVVGLAACTPVHAHICDDNVRARQRGCQHAHVDILAAPIASLVKPSSRRIAGSIAAALLAQVHRVLADGQVVGGGIGLALWQTSPILQAPLRHTFAQSGRSTATHDGPSSPRPLDEEMIHQRVANQGDAPVRKQWCQLVQGARPAVARFQAESSHRRRAAKRLGTRPLVVSRSAIRHGASFCCAARQPRHRSPLPHSRRLLPSGRSAVSRERGRESSVSQVHPWSAVEPRAVLVTGRSTRQGGRAGSSANSHRSIRCTGHAAGLAGIPGGSAGIGRGRPIAPNSSESSWLNDFALALSRCSASSFHSSEPPGSGDEKLQCPPVSHAPPKKWRCGIVLTMMRESCLARRALRRTRRTEPSAVRKCASTAASDDTLTSLGSYQLPALRSSTSGWSAIAAAKASLTSSNTSRPSRFGTRNWLRAYVNVRLCRSLKTLTSGEAPPFDRSWSAAVFQSRHTRETNCCLTSESPTKAMERLACVRRKAAASNAAAPSHFQPSRRSAR
eukprot:6788011-Prymnesium_polylepis.2